MVVQFFGVAQMVPTDFPVRVQTFISCAQLAGIGRDWLWVDVKSGATKRVPLTFNAFNLYPEKDTPRKRAFTQLVHFDY